MHQAHSGALLWKAVLMPLVVQVRRAPFLSVYLLSYMLYVYVALQRTHMHVFIHPSMYAYTHIQTHTDIPALHAYIFVRPQVWQNSYAMP